MADSAETLVIRIRLLEQRAFAAGTARARAEIRGVATEAKAANATMAKASFSAGLLGAGWHQMTRAARHAGLGIAAAGIAGAVAGVHFEQEMARVASVVDLSGKNYAIFSHRAQVESTRTRFSATEAAEGMYLLGRAGFHASEILHALSGTLSLAHASGIGLGQAAQIQGEAIRGFGLKANEAGRVADVLARATRGGNVSMQDLQYTIKYVGAASFNTGQKMEDMVGLIEAMARHGIRGTMAGTGLRSMLTRLIDPVKGTRDGLAMLNLQASDLYGPNGLLPLPQILDKIRVQMAKLDKVSASRALHKITGQWAFQAVSAIVTTDPRVVHGFIRDLNNAKGTAKDMAEILNNTVQMQMLRFYHTLQTIGIGVYMSFRIPLKNALKDVNEWLARIVKNMPYLQYYLEHRQWHNFTEALDRITGSGGKLNRAIWWTVYAAKTLWTFISTIVLPVSMEWGKVLLYVVAAGLYLIVKAMALMNRHSTIAKFLIGTLIGLYIHWKIITLALAAAEKVHAFWLAVVAARTKLLAAGKWIWMIIKAVKLWIWYQWGLNAAMLANPIVLIVVGLIALAAVLAVLYIRWGAFHRTVDRFFNWLWAHWEVIALLPVVGQLVWAVGMIIKHWNTLENFFRNAPSRMARAGKDFWGWLTGGFKSAIRWIFAQINRLNFTLHVPEIGLGPLGSIGGGSYNIGVGHYDPFGVPTSNKGTPGMGPGGAAGRVASKLPPKVLDPAGPMQDMVSTGKYGAYRLPPISVQIDGKEVAKAVSKHDATTKARQTGRKRK